LLEKKIQQKKRLGSATWPILAVFILYCRFGTLPRNGNQHADSGAGSTVGTLSRLTASTYTKLKAVAAFSDKYFTNKESAEEELSFLK